MRKTSTIVAKAALAMSALLTSFPLIQAWAGGPAAATGFSAGAYGTGTAAGADTGAGGANGPVAGASSGTGGADGPAAAGASSGTGGAAGPAAAAVNSGVVLLADGCSGGSGGAC
jgi:hypothetical protein